ncbi:MAG: potassium transporter TrkG [Candidatus Babeliales bacterium]
MAHMKIAHFSPGRTLLISYIIAIIAGTTLLALPFARTTHIPLIDLIFSAASTTTVTGALTVPIDQFSFFGKCVILFLIQVSGIGFATISFFMMTLFVKLGLSSQMIAGQVLEIDAWQNIKKIIIFIVLSTIFFESIGAAFIFGTIRHHYPFYQAIFLAIFTSVSAFCNAGMSLFPHGMQVYNHNIPFLLLLSFLITMGGLGFTTLYEVFIWSLKKITRKKRAHQLSLNSKIVLKTTMLLISMATIIFWILEHNNTLAGMPLGVSFVNALFTATVDRSAGFSLISINSLQMASLFMILILSFIGSSPGSTGSGIKTTVFAVYLATVRAAIMGRQDVDIHHRRIQQEQVYKAMAIITLSLTWIAITTFFLLITEQNWQFLDIFFEAVSAFTNLGLSTGITKHLSTIGKLFIIVSMVIGRIGSLTLMLALRRHIKKQEFSYPEERVMLS